MILDVWLTNNIAASYPEHLTANDAELPIRSIYGKVLDCDGNNLPAWQGLYDARSPVSLGDAERVAELYRGQGITYRPWGVSRGIYPRAEGLLAGQVSRALGQPFILDLEDERPYYWHGGAEAVRLWCEAYRESANELWVAPDARRGHPGIQLDAWIESGLVTRWMPQAYWTAFQQPWMAGIANAYTPIVEGLRATGLSEEAAVARIFPIYPGDAPADELRAAINWSQVAPAFGGFSLWHRGMVPRAFYGWLGEMPEYAGPAPATPAPPPEPVRTYEDGLREGRTLGRIEAFDEAVAAIGAIRY